MYWLQLQRVHQQAVNKHLLLFNNRLDERLQNQSERLLPRDVSVVLVKERATNRKHTKMISFLLNRNSALSEQLEALNARLKDLSSNKQDLTKETDALIQQKTTLEKVKV